MTREEAKEMWPVAKAFSEGRDVEFFDQGKWHDNKGTGFGGGYKYRIKPTPTYRPWKPEEVPVGSQIRSKTTVNNARCMILAVKDNGVLRPHRDGQHLTADALSFEELFVRHEHSLDNGLSWKPCGVLTEEAQ
jgi:hypothetical protein